MGKSDEHIVSHDGDKRQVCASQGSSKNLVDYSTLLLLLPEPKVEVASGEYCIFSTNRKYKVASRLIFVANPYRVEVEVESGK